MKALHIDLETYSSEDLKTSGVYKYCESIDFEILILVYTLDDGPVRTLSLATGTEIPAEVDQALRDDRVQKHAHNANFERVCLIQYGYDIPASSWSCSAVKAAYCGLPRHLAGVSKALNLGEEAKSEGAALIRYFCGPIKPTKANGQRHRNLPAHDPEKWAKFCQYCAQDVVAEMAVVKALAGYTLPEIELENYELDQKINDAGVLIDLPFAKKAIEVDERRTAEVVESLRELTGMVNPNSDPQFKKWLLDKTGVVVPSLNKEGMDDLIDNFRGRTTFSRKFYEIVALSPTKIPEYDGLDVVHALELRKLIKKASIKKYAAMVKGACLDSRVRGVFLFYGAHTGRWSARIVQLHNMTKNYMENLATAKEAILTGANPEDQFSFEDLPSILSELIRTALIASRGKTFLVSDFSSIEARVLAWLAGAEWKLRVFRTHGKIYEAVAAQMFGVDIDSVTKGSDLRAKGKIAELALGFGGSKGALAKMGGEKMGLSEDDMVSIVKKWRKANPDIVAFWKTIEKAAKRAVRLGKPVLLDWLTFDYDGKALTIELPSGRKLFYQKPRFGLDKFDGECLTYLGARKGQFLRIDVWGGTFVENIVQAIARDLLADAMRALDFEGFDIVMHVHDEAVCETFDTNMIIQYEDGSEAAVGGGFAPATQLKTMCSIMSRESEWAPGLPLAADGYITPFYKKD